MLNESIHLNNICIYPQISNITTHLSLNTQMHISIVQAHPPSITLVYQIILLYNTSLSRILLKSRQIFCSTNNWVLLIINPFSMVANRFKINNNVSITYSGSLFESENLHTKHLRIIFYLRHTPQYSIFI